MTNTMMALGNYVIGNSFKELYASNQPAGPLLNQVCYIAQAARRLVTQVHGATAVCHRQVRA